jgi:ABC-type transport system involved in Fe-S cluster assembly fused permease/ATPase subunit
MHDSVWPGLDAMPGILLTVIVLVVVVTFGWATLADWRVTRSRRRRASSDRAADEDSSSYPDIR